MKCTKFSQLGMVCSLYQHILIRVGMEPPATNRLQLLDTRFSFKFNFNLKYEILQRTIVKKLL